MVKIEKDLQMDVSSSFLANVESERDCHSAHLEMDIENYHCDEMNKIKTELDLIHDESNNFTELDLSGNGNKTVRLEERNSINLKRIQPHKETDMIGTVKQIGIDEVDGKEKIGDKSNREPDITQNRGMNFSEVGPSINDKDAAVEKVKQMFMCQLCQRVFAKCSNGYRHVRSVHKKRGMDVKKFITPVLEMDTLAAVNVEHTDTGSFEDRNFGNKERTQAHYKIDMEPQIAIGKVEANENLCELSNESGFMCEEESANKKNSHLGMKKDDIINNSSVKVHLSRIDDIVPKYVCQLCKTTFGLEAHAYRHLINVHNKGEADIVDLINIEKRSVLELENYTEKEDNCSVSKMENASTIATAAMNYICLLCKKKYTRADIAYTHLRMVHKQETGLKKLVSIENRVRMYAGQCNDDTGHVIEKYTKRKPGSSKLVNVDRSNILDTTQNHDERDTAGKTGSVVTQKNICNMEHEDKCDESVKEKVNCLEKDVHDGSILCPLCGSLFTSREIIISHLINTHSVKQNFIESTLEYAGKYLRERESKSGNVSGKHAIEMEYDGQIQGEELESEDDNDVDLAVEYNTGETSEACDKEGDTTQIKAMDIPPGGNLEDNIEALEIQVKHESEDVNAEYYNPVEQDDTKANKMLDTNIGQEWHIAKLVCDQCGKECSGEDELNIHINSAHKCPFCDISFKNKKPRLKHIQKAHSDMLLIKCTLCGKRFHEQMHLKCHHSLCHKDRGPKKSHKCLFCNRTYKDIRSKKTHMEKDHSFECHICKLIFLDEGQLSAHLQQNHKDDEKGDDNHCHICGTVFTNSSELTEHMNNPEGTKCLHHNKRRFSCLECGKTFRDKYDLNAHISHVHKGVKYPCDICGKLFTAKNSVKKHIFYMHSGERNHVCDICGHASKKTQDLRLHMLLHTGEKDYKCELCEKAFLRPDHLKIHMFQHTGEKRYKCSECDRAFSRSDVLRIHMRTHTGEKPYKCEICAKKFSQACALRAHSKTHKRILHLV